MNRIINILYFTQWCDCTYWQPPCWLASLGRLAGFLYSDAILFVVIVVLTYFVMFSLFWWSNPKDVFCFSLQASLAHEPIIFNYLFSVDFPSHLVCVSAFVLKKILLYSRILRLVEQKKWSSFCHSWEAELISHTRQWWVSV